MAIGALVDWYMRRIEGAWTLEGAIGTAVMVASIVARHAGL